MGRPEPRLLGIFAKGASERDQVSDAGGEQCDAQRQREERKLGWCRRQPTALR